jgi:hypothetical protein
MENKFHQPGQETFEILAKMLRYEIELIRYQRFFR